MGGPPNTERSERAGEVGTLLDILRASLKLILTAPEASAASRYQGARVLTIPIGESTTSSGDDAACPCHSSVYAEASGLKARGSQSGRRRPPGPGAGRAMASHSR